MVAEFTGLIAVYLNIRIPKSQWLLLTSSFPTNLEL